MIFPQEIQHIQYILRDNPQAVRTLVQFILQSIEQGNPPARIALMFALDEAQPKLDKLDCKLDKDRV